MTTLILDDFAEARVLAERRASGLDRFDEVWDGVYIMSPIADNEHQFVASELSAVLREVCRELKPKIYAACNVSDQEVDWTKNYRCPDVAVYLPGNPAKNMQKYWFGGPDFAIEVCSQKDRTWDKLDFYASVQTRELLIIDRDPWKLSLLRLIDRKLVVVATNSLDLKDAAASAVMPASFRLVPRPGQQPLIEVQNTDGQSWLVDPDLG
jgi:Uma2 family endonuclease